MKRKTNDAESRNISLREILILSGFTVTLLFLVVCVILFFRQKAEATDSELSAQSIDSVMDSSENEISIQNESKENTSSIEVVESVMESDSYQMLQNMESYYEENSDIVGWLKIEGTKIDYPVMYTPDDPEKYIDLDYNGNPSSGGALFIDAKCSMEPESDNLLIHGHNMKDETMFGSLINYDMKDYWKEHPKISFTTLYEEREYEIVAAFYDRVYYTHEDCFKYYQFIDAENETAFNEAITYFKDNALYDTGVTAQYGDKLITLSTCAYHVDNGRFVVVAKEKS